MPERLGMRFDAIAALILQGITGEANPRLEEFTRYDRRVSPGLDQTWIYSGSRHFFATHPIDASTRKTLLGLLDPLDKHK